MDSDQKSLQETDPSLMSNEELIKENRRLQSKVDNAIKFSLVLGVSALLFLGVVVGMLINKSLEDDCNCDVI